MNKVFKVGLIGCGHIAETYFRAHKYFNNFKIIKCADVKSEAAKKCAKTYRIQAVSVNELLKDKKVEIKYRDVHSRTLTNDVQYFPPKERVY